jgi:serine/threonine-protein kinase
MGEVLRARDSVLGREVAVKILHAALARDDAFIDRFRREARAAATLSHPNIVGVHDWGERGDTSFMVMEFVRGPNLRDVLTEHGRLEPAQAVEVLLQMLAALEHAHRHGIVHRDVKPENVLVTPEGVVKVADFGLAHALAESRVTQAPGTVTGTVQYLSPEQIHGEPADPRTDLYSLGIVAYELLTGRPPFSGETSLAIAYKHLSEPVPAPSEQAPAVSPQLDRIVLRATAKDPEDRPRSAADMRHDLVAVAGSLPPAPSLAALVSSMPEREHGERTPTVTIPQVITARRGHRKHRRGGRRWWIAAAIAAVVLAGAWALWTYVVPHHTTVPPVLGLSLADARGRLDDAGLDVRVGQPMKSLRYPAGTVARLNSAPGTELDRGADIVVRLSDGPPLRTVPKLVGGTIRHARKAADPLGFTIDVVERYSQTVASGDVITQTPPADSRIEYGSTLHLVVSKGPQPVQVPSLVGLPVDEATTLLTRAGFDIERTDEFSTTVPRGDVVAQHPKNGMAPKGSTVSIVVSKGPPEFPMPNVAGEGCFTANQSLDGLGLDTHIVVIPSSSGNTVVGQNPSPDTTVRPGDSVTIYCA